MKRIVYIMGGARSGSSLLDVMLGNSSGVVSGGELRRFTTNRGKIKARSSDDPCCAFWSRFRDRLEDALGGLDFGYLEKMTRRVEYHTRFVIPATYRLNSRLMMEYRHYVRTFFDVLFECVNGDVVVDSSKYPGRVLALYRLLDIPVHVIYLVRHPVGVVRSFGKRDIEQPRKNFLAANVYYGVNAMLCSSVFHHLAGENRLRIRYKDLVLHPIDTMSRIEQAFGLDLEESKRRLNEDVSLDVGCLYDGNRLRMQYQLSVRKNESRYGWGPSDILTRLMNGVWY